MVILRKVNLETCNLNNFSYPDPLTVAASLKSHPLSGTESGGDSRLQKKTLSISCRECVGLRWAEGKQLK